MITKQELKYFASLKQKKYRVSEKKFLVEGTKIVSEGLESNYNCERVFVTNQFDEENGDFLRSVKQKYIKVDVINAPEFRRLSDTESQQGIAAVFEMKESLSIEKLNDDKIIVYFDDISDPGNAGTIIRTCDWFGVNSIILSNDSVEFYNPKLIRASMGSIFRMNRIEDDNFKAIDKLRAKGFKVYCSDLRGENISNISSEKKSVLVFSKEATGVSPELKNLTDQFITIKGSGEAESLNVSVAAGIIIHHFSKK